MKKHELSGKKEKKRINWNNLYFKFDNKDSASEEILNKMDNLPYSNKLILVNRPYKNLKSQCVIPGQEHLPELAIMSDPLNTFDIMAWLKKRWQCSLSASYCAVAYKSISYIFFKCSTS